MIVGYAVLYKDGTLVISKKHSILSKKVRKRKDYGQFEDTNVPWKKESSQIKEVQILDQVKSNYLKKWFEDCINLTTLINFQNLDTSDCTNFSKMFSFCTSLQDISALESWNVSNGKYFSSMFRYCTSLQNISLPNSLRCLDENMFKDCNPNLKIRWKQYLYTYADLLEYKKIY